MIKGKGINGELKISTLLETYTDECYQEVKKMDSSYPWLDKGSHNSMLNELNFDRTFTERKGLQISSPNKITHKLGYINVKE